MEEREEKRGGPGCASTGIVLILLPVLYLLGIGPSSAIARNWPVTSDLVRALYWPVTVVTDRFLPFQFALDWYVKLWTG